MKQVLVPSVLMSEGIILRKKRELPAFGSVLKQVGDLVSPQDVIAETTVPSAVFVVRVAQMLEVDASELSKKCVVKEGERVKKGQLLATHSGLFGLIKSNVYAPVDGEVEYISQLTGHVGIRLPAKLVNVSAYVEGTVVEVIDKKGVVIESHCAMVQGIFGVGGERHGKLRAVAVAPSELIRQTSLPDDIRGAILFGGSGVTLGALKLAAEKGAVAVVTGAIDDQTLNQYLGYQLGVAITGNEKVLLTLIVTEGFGQIAMNDKTLSLLKKHSGVNASVNGATQVRAGAMRPEILIFSNDISVANASSTQSALEVGARVRVIRYPHFGMIGTVSALPNELSKLETGAEARVVVVNFSDGRTLTVPRANVEVT